MQRTNILLTAGASSLLLAAACSGAPSPPAETAASPPARQDEPAPVPTTLAASPSVSPVVASEATILVHKSPTCSCCTKWVDHLRAAGFAVEVRETDDLRAVQARVGVPAGKGSCHTAEVGGYFVEGHVPAADIRRLLAERPDARGLTVPGMPMGSPGMEAPGYEQPYAVELIDRDGGSSEFARHGPSP